MKKKVTPMTDPQAPKGQDAPERILVRVDYDGTHDGTWIAVSPYEPPIEYTGQEPQYTRADLLTAAQARIAELEGERETIKTAWLDACTRSGANAARAEQAEAEVKRARETNRRVQRRLQLLEGWWQRRVSRAQNERSQMLFFMCRKTDAQNTLRRIEEAAYQRGYQDGHDDRFIIPKRKAKPRRAALSEGGKDTAARCAECDCENGGTDCNWIKSDTAQKGGE
jgi:hypothetical protein